MLTGTPHAKMKCKIIIYISKTHVGYVTINNNLQQVRSTGNEHIKRCHQKLISYQQTILIFNTIIPRSCIQLPIAQLRIHHAVLYLVLFTVHFQQWEDNFCTCRKRHNRNKCFWRNVSDENFSKNLKHSIIKSESVTHQQKIGIHAN